MKKHSICMAKVIKNISYVLVPIFLLLLISSIVSILIVQKNIQIKNADNYYETELFTDVYLGDVYSIYNSADKGLMYEENSTPYITIYDDKQSDVDIYGKKGTIYYFNNHSSNLKYLVINKKAGFAQTNLEHTMKTDTIDEIIQELNKNKIYWNYEQGNVKTSINSLSLENIRYNNIFEYMIQQSSYLNAYTGLLNDLPYDDAYAVSKLECNLIINLNKISAFIIPVSLIALVFLVNFIFKGIGKTAQTGEIYLNWFDRWKLEIVFLISISMALFGIYIFAGSSITESITLKVTCMGIGLFIIYLDAILMVETIVKRIKTHTLIKSTIIYLIYKIVRDLVADIKITIKVFLIFGGFCLLGFMLTVLIVLTSSNDQRFLYTIMLLTLGFLSFWYLYRKIKEFDTVKNALKSIYEGNTNIKLNPSEQKGVLKEMTIYINDIAGGLSNAINESLKSERLKTELITNVSHDIKTPLTSIINYVDLLKKEKMPNEKCTEYLMILDNKSQRLKRLTEDLVEASKASSGNIKLKMEQINVVELVKQVSGEFEDKFKARGLEEVMTLPKDTAVIMADGRYLYRVLENIYSNTAKYAMENTRVYLDVVVQSKSVVIQMKNISQEKLNISADELMQRFVRGEASRNTEGSGLGLSIASSLTQLQGGKFHIYLDGDLFKITLGFERI